MEVLVTGIDDIGTMGAKSEGWTFISFPESLLEEFNIEANSILTESKLSSFHAKDFKKAKVEYYKKFLLLIRKTLEKETNSFICCTLSDELWKKCFNNFCTNCINESFKNAGITDEQFIEASIKLSLPLFTYMRKATEHIKADSTSIDIDSDSILKRINAKNIIVNGYEISSNNIIFSALNAYRKKQFGNAPEINRGMIRVLNDEDSFLIQAADMFGNFSTALAAKILGKDSKSNNLKATVFSNVFGDLIDTSQLAEMVKLENDEVVLKDSGVFNFTIG